jgi:hypothetical protein
MTALLVRGFLIGCLALPALAAGPVLSQPTQQHPPMQSQLFDRPDTAVGLTEQEQLDFEIRWRTARTMQERADIEAERNHLLETRARQQTIMPIPPSAAEAGDPLAPDVPTPRPNSTVRSGSTLPGGALSETGTGTSPAINRGGSGFGNWGAEGR